MVKEGAKQKWTLKMVLQFAIMCIGASGIYGVIYMKGVYYNIILEVLNINDMQYGVLFSIYAAMTIATYFLGGVLADKASARKLLTFSFVSTGLLQFWYISAPGYTIICILFGLMGVTTTLTFWAPLIKATRMIGASTGKESTVLGGLEAGRGIWGILLGTITVTIFTKAATQALGLKIIWIIYAGMTVLCGILSWFVIPDTPKKDISEEEKPWKLIKECLSYKAVWINSLIVMGGYAMTSTVGAFAGKIMMDKYTIVATTAAWLSLFRTYIAPVGSLGGGVLGDKIGATKTLSLGIIGMMLTCLAFIYLPAEPAKTMLTLFVVITCLMTLFSSCCRGQWYAPLRESGLPMRLSGTAIGLIATIGYLPDVFMSLITGWCLTKYDGMKAFEIVLWILVGFGVFAILMVLLMNKLNKNVKPAEE